MTKRLLLFSFLGVFFLVLVKNVLAVDLVVNCNDSGCSPTTASSIFPSDFWYPGRSVSRSIQINNIGTNGLAISNKAQDPKVIGNLDQVIHFSILRSSDNLVIWSGTLNNFYGAGNINLGSLGAGTNNSFNYTMTMNSTAGDDYQSKSTAYDLLLTFTGGSSAGGGAVLGASTGGGVSCNDAKPGSAPKITAITSGLNSVTVFWDKAADPVSYYLITYGTSSGAQTYGNPNVGGKDTTSYTINGLSGGTYYFEVRAGNGCMPGDYSNEFSAIPTGGFVAGPAAGFIPGVLGEQENLNSGLSTGAAGIRGVEGASTAGNNFNWWWLLLIPGGLLLLFFLRKMRRNENY